MKSNLKAQLALQTPVEFSQSSLKLTHQNEVFCLGSCFATHMFEQLQNHWFTSMLNPCGITYNPMSMAKQLKWFIEEKKPSKPKYIENAWVPFDFHGDFRRENEQHIIEKTQTYFDGHRDFFAKSTVDIYTFGTAFVYEYESEIVNNCHKIPSRYFEERLLTTSEILHNWTPLLDDIQKKHPKKEIVFTLSPVRHRRNGLIGNSVSKSILRTCIYELTKRDGVHYFPSYEILLDELRDYRFYKEDMLHPSTQACRYIWQVFVESFMCPKTQKRITEIAKIQKMKNHRFLNPTVTEKADFNALIRSKESAVREEIFKFIQKNKE